MMNMIPYHNETEKFVHIGAVTIPPGETRDVDPRILQGYVPPEVFTETSTDPLVELLKLPISKLILGLPDLSDDELIRLEALEQAKEKPRASALAEITQERLRRAEVKTPGNPLAEGTGGEGGTGTGGEGN